MKCIVCSNEIPAARLLVLPFTKKCLSCSDEKTYTETPYSSAYSLAPALDRIDTEGRMVEVRDDAVADAQRAEETPNRIIDRLEMTPAPTDAFAVENPA